MTPLSFIANEIAQTKQLELESQILLDEALATAKIEGELLERNSMCSSIASRLGVGKVTTS